MNNAQIHEIDELGDYYQQLELVRMTYRTHLSILLIEPKNRDEFLKKVGILFGRMLHSKLLELDEDIIRQLEEFSKFSAPNIVAIKTEEYLATIVKLLPVLQEMIQRQLKLRGVNI